jgi:hypothetical protein
MAASSGYFFFCRASTPTHGKGPLLCVRRKAHNKGSLSCKYLSCGLCGAFLRKTHSKGFAVRFLMFVVRTAIAGFPVV